MLMRISGRSDITRLVRESDTGWTGQRIVARLREQMYAASVRQEVEFIEKSEGDVISRLSVDTSVVGERSVRFF